jgi:HSP20 family molecular chaperone IbpA
VATARVALIRSSSIVDELEQVHHRISERAYERYRTSDGCGTPDEDWLKAERELFWQPAVEVRRKDSRFEVRAAVAGVDAKDLSITVSPEHLVIKGNGAHVHQASDVTVHSCEFSGGQLFRVVPFPEPVVPEDVTAECRNGLLTVTAPIPGSKPATRPVVKARSRR